MVSGIQCPLVSVCEVEMVTGAAAPKGPMAYAFTDREIFSPPQGKDTGLEARI